jgi:hypothetical protein
MARRKRVGQLAEGLGLDKAGTVGPNTLVFLSYFVQNLDCGSEHSRLRSDPVPRLELHQRAARK